MTGLRVLVIGQVGDDAGAAAFADAARMACDGPVELVAVPGHPTRPAVQLETADVVLAALDHLRGSDRSPTLVVGIGTSGWATTVLALGGRADRLLLVDGVGPWVDPTERVLRVRAHRRAIAADPSAHAPPPPEGPDPRARHGIVAMASRDLWLRCAAALEVPTIVAATPATGLTAAEAAELAAANPLVTLRPVDTTPSAAALLADLSA